MKLPRTFLAAFFAACFMTVAALAADASPAGTWKWTQAGRGGNPGTERTLKLELKDGQLSGKVLAYQGQQGEMPENPIVDASFKGGAVAFSVKVTWGDNSFVVKYAGQLDGDTLKGTIERPGRDGGDPTKTEWVAKRAK